MHLLNKEATSKPSFLLSGRFSFKYLPKSQTEGFPGQYPARQAEGESCTKCGRENICGLAAGLAVLTRTLCITLNGTSPTAAHGGEEWTL